MLQATRTLVKSAPELWSEVSDPSALARHLAPFGSVRILSSQPESTVEWAGDKATGRVTLEPSGFGTRVRFQIEIACVEAAPGADAVPEAEPEPAPEPEPAAAEPAPAAKPGFWARLFRRRAPEPEPAPAPAPAPVAPPPPAPEREPVMADDAALLVLTDTLDALGRAHHRPFSRA